MFRAWMQIEEEGRGAVIPGDLRMVLNVQADGETREAVARMLGAEGLRIRNAVSADEARAALAGPEGRPAGLVLVDASLDDAEALCRDLRREAAALLLTRPGEDGPPARLGAFADDILHGPPDPNRWLPTIRAWARAGSRLIEARGEAERWRSIFEAIDEGMAMLDPDGLIRWCNAAMGELLGAPAEELVESRLADRAARLIPPGRDWPHERTLRSGARSRDEWEVGHRWFRSTAAPMRGPSGALASVVATLEDVTPEVRLRLRIAQVEAEGEARAERINRLEREARLYQALAGIPARTEDRGSPRQEPLSRRFPDVFCDALDDFGRVLDTRLLQRGYRTEAGPDVSAILTAIAERLAAADSGPRDVVELHAMALRQRSSGAQAAKINAYVEEAQVAVLEVMGRLAEHYRAGRDAAARPRAVASDQSPGPDGVAG